MHEYVTAGNKLPERFVLMRHDVDNWAKNALKTASVEEEYGIRATYYFRTHKKAFVPDIIQEIEKMGHEVGYHYEALSTAKGDYEKAIKLFEDDVQKFREICNIKTVCMHGAVLSKYDNRDLWKSYNLRDFGILGEAYLSAGKNLNYFTDTGRGWNSKNNMRDFIPGKTEKFSAERTDDLIKLVDSCEINNFYISLHPDRWKSNIANWSIFWLYDFVLNTGKKIVMAVRQ
ncbi:hypothetical protein ACSAZL_15595 [Methanosarcina sp. T3]|uniref:hypothetical protein n=1 Tax=Methanosarcina sp. T3 TaxID=3439062 RepID=UPI003F87785B